jgi:hypothetical protein
VNVCAGMCGTGMTPDEAREIGDRLNLVAPWTIGPRSQKRRQPQCPSVQVGLNRESTVDVLPREAGKRVRDRSGRALNPDRTLGLRHGVSGGISQPTPELRPLRPFL